MRIGKEIHISKPKCAFAALCDLEVKGSVLRFWAPVNSCTNWVEVLLLRCEVRSKGNTIGEEHV